MTWGSRHNPPMAEPIVETETDRLRLRRLDASDATFIFRLVNEPSWLRFIGDRGVHDLDGARRYIAEGPQRLYANHGFGLFLVERRSDALPLGLCGLIKRDTLPDVDIGFAFLPEQKRGAGSGGVLPSGATAPRQSGYRQRAP